MYSGNGKVIEAQKTGTKIKEHSDWKWAGEARRYLDDKDIGTTTTTGDGTTDNGTTTTTEEVITSTNPSMVDKLSNALGQVFQGYTNSMLFGDEYKGIDWDSVNGITRTLKTTTNDGSNNGGDTGSNGSGAIATSLDDAIAQKATELIIRNESGGDYSSCNNDVNASTGASISPSIGIMQWRYENARRIMKEMYAKLPNSSDAKYFAEWNWNSDSPWSSSQRSRLKNYLQKNHSITKPIQDNLAKEHVANNLLSKVNKYSDRLDNPSAKVFMAEIGNTGPDLINRYLKNYKGPKSNFQGFYNDFMKNSYWGPKSIYKNRLTKSYNELKDWTPKYAGKGPDEEELPLVNNVGDNTVVGKGPDEIKASKSISKLPTSINTIIGKGIDEPVVDIALDDSPFKLPESPKNEKVGKGPEVSKLGKITKSIFQLPKTIKSSIIGKGPEEPRIVNKIDKPRITPPSLDGVIVDDASEKPRIVDIPGFRKTEPTDIERLIKNNIITRSEIKNANSNFGMGSDENIDISNILKTQAPTTTGIDVTTDISAVDTPVKNQAMKKALREHSLNNNRSQELLRNAVDVLKSIGVNTFNTAKGVNKIIEKDFTVKVVSTSGTVGSSSNNIIVPPKVDNGSVNIHQEKNESSKKSNLKRAMAIAKGLF